MTILSSPSPSRRAAGRGRRRIPIPTMRRPSLTTACGSPGIVCSFVLLAALLPLPTPFVSAHAPSTALFDALDADRDGVISPQDWSVSMSKITTSLGIDTHELQDEMDAVAGGEVGAMGRNEAAAAHAQRRDGLTGENLVPKKQLGSLGGASFNPATAGGASRKSNSDVGPDGKKKKLSFTKAFTASVAMILATEIGDKTFFIAAVLSMRNDRAAVFGGAILALIVMTVLSTMMGLVLPSILPRRYTHIIGGLLFLYFGIKLILDSRTMEDKVSDELEEVEEELLHTKNKKDEVDSESDMENGSVGSAPESGNAAGRKKPAKRSASGIAGATAYKSTSFQATFVQSLTLTFLAEWGDRSQIATIALAAAKDPLGVTIGGCIGHSMCTGLAVVGGRMLAARISEKTVSFYGGIIFTVFGIHSLFFET